MTLRFAHISDPHFGTERLQVMGELCRTLRALAPELVVLSGDITQRARRSQFTAAGAFLRTLAPLPVLAVPGNHDIPLFNLLARFCWPYRGYQRVFGEDLAPDLGIRGVRFFGFNTAPYWRHKHGELEPQAAARRLAADDSACPLRVAVLHHPLDCRSRSDDSNLLRPAPDVVEIFASHGVDLVLGGHIHDPYAAASSERYPQTSPALVIALAGTCVSTRTRVRAPNSFNLITLDEGPQPTQAIERWDMGAGGEFAPVACNSFVRDGATGWRPLPGRQSRCMADS